MYTVPNDTGRVLGGYNIPFTDPASKCMVKVSNGNNGKSVKYVQSSQ